MSPGRVRRILAGVRGEPRIPSLGEIARILFGKDHKGGCFAVIVPVLKSYLDESSDGGNKEVFCVGAILANEVQFPPMENAWLERLRVPDDIPYFHASACNGVHEPFFKLRSKYGADAQAVVDQLRIDLESILLLHPWVGFGLGVHIPDYREVWEKNSDAKKLYEEDPTQAAYQQMFFEITKSAQSYSKDCQISFIVDNSTYSGRIADAFEATKINHPDLAASMTTIAPLDDKITPSLQMADLIASVYRKFFLERAAMGKATVDLKWGNHLDLFGIWHKDHMLNTIEKNLRDPRYHAGQLPKRSIPTPTKTEMKRQEKRRRKGLIKALGEERQEK